MVSIHIMALMGTEEYISGQDVAVAPAPAPTVTATTTSAPAPAAVTIAPAL